ncbi:uncharacterized protein CMC5_081040 [Chondromyces crocatus]|uniref:Uncharacterized protein n=1 Tax=Chondromyces crocatus TaxID=52 RepID=A0A0K1ET85_CHOCO|nr:uncharacterized protein CMC5_081040 [Chondromyces crocatus]
MASAVAEAGVSRRGVAMGSRRGARLEEEASHRIRQEVAPTVRPRVNRLRVVPTARPKAGATGRRLVLDTVSLPAARPEQVTDLAPSSHRQAPGLPYQATRQPDTGRRTVNHRAERGPPSRDNLLLEVVTDSRHPAAPSVLRAGVSVLRVEVTVLRVEVTGHRRLLLTAVRRRDRARALAVS